jgi:hypothetical protein
MFGQVFDEDRQNYNQKENHSNTKYDVDFRTTKMRLIKYTLLELCD